MKENWMESYPTETAVEAEQDTPDTGETGSEPAVEPEAQPVIESLGSTYSKPGPEASNDPFSGR